MADYKGMGRLGHTKNEGIRVTYIVIAVVIVFALLLIAGHDGSDTGDASPF